MTISHSSGKFLPICIQISLTGFAIITIIVLSFIPLYIKDQSVEIPARSPSVYLLYNVTFHVTMLSISETRAAQSSLNVTVFSLSTLKDIQNQLNQNFATIQATCIITAATYKSDVSNLILTLKVSFYNPCPDSSSTCAKTQLRLVTNIILQLQSLTTNGQCYSSCISSPHSCSFVATIAGPPSSFTVVDPSNNQGPIGNPCPITTVASTSTVRSISTANRNPTTTSRSIE